MSFQDIPKIEDAKFYVNLAFKTANEKAQQARQKVSKQRSVLEKSKVIEIEKLRAVKDFLTKKLGKIIKDFPSINNLNKFYEELLKCYAEVDKLKKALASLNWAANKVSDFFVMYRNKIKATRNFEKINEYRRMFYGRVSSAMKQVDRNLEIIENARRAVKDFPVIKEGLFTAAISGFPNVGKSTLLSKLSSSKPEIAGYAFTTKSLNVGYIMKDSRKAVQLIDTPGTLNRFDRMNNIEKQAHLAMKHLADAIVYVFDPTETYPMKEQEKLLKKVKKDFDRKTIVYVSKTDLAETSKKGFTDPEDLKKELLKRAGVG